MSSTTRPSPYCKQPNIERQACRWGPYPKLPGSRKVLYTAGYYSWRRALTAGMTVSPGKSCRLSEEQRWALEEDLRKSPKESGFLREPCTDKMIVRRIGNRFGIKYGTNRILGLTYRVGFSVRKPRLVSHNSTTEGEQKAYVERTVKEVVARDGAGYKVLCLGVAGSVGSPTFGRGIQPRGEIDTI